MSCSGVFSVYESSYSKNWQRRQSCHAEYWVFPNEEDCYTADLKYGYESLFYSVNEKSLHRGDVFGYSGHDVSGSAGVEPFKWKSLEFGVKFRAKVKDCFLFEDVVNEYS